MGFYINELDVNVKQHVNLSNYAWSVIDEDIINFNNSMDKSSFSGFLNPSRHYLCHLVSLINHLTV